MSEHTNKDVTARVTLPRILRFLAPHGPALAGALALAACVVVSTLLVPVLAGQAVDAAVGPGRVDYARLATTLRTLALAIAVTAASQWLLTALTNRVAFSVVRDMRVAAFDKLQHLPISYLDAHRHGDIVNRIVTDADQFSNGLVMSFQQLFTGVLTIVLTLVFMVRLNAGVTLVVVCVTPASFLTAKLIAERGYASFHEQSERRGELTGYVEEYVGGRAVLEAFDAQGMAERAFEDADARLGQASFRAVFVSSLVNPTTRFVNSLVYAGVGIFGALAAIGGALTAGGLTAFLSYANQYTKPFNDISEVVTELQNSLACAARLFELLDEAEEEPDAPDATVLTGVRGQVDIDDVSFSYVPDRPLIEGLELHVRPGERVAIVGPTGCGKTTLINLLLRFYDVDAGTIRVDGQDIAGLTRDSLRRAFGMVLQETWLFEGAVHDNIAYGKPDATREEVIAAAERAHADSFIRQLPNGYDTVIGEDGGTFSQGQKQLLCIARVMLTDPAILLLDEATSSIDTRTELQVQTAFDEMIAGRTSLIVAHRLSTIREADCILVLKDGRLIERGTHDELLAQGGFYAELYNSQWATAE